MLKLEKTELDLHLQNMMEDDLLEGEEKVLDGKINSLNTLDSQLTKNTKLVDLDDSLTSTLKYIDGGITRKMLNKTSCSTCIPALLDKVNHGKHTTDYLELMDFVGTALVEPKEDLFLIFHTIFTVYNMAKEHLARLSLEENVGRELALLAFRLVKTKGWTIELCEKHKHHYMYAMTLSTVKTFLKAYVGNVNQEYTEKRRESVLKKAQKLKDRKLLVLSGNN